MPVKTIDPKQCIITFGGVGLHGFADGTFLGISRENDAFSKSSGADGEVTRVRTSDKSTAITLTLAQSSDSNDYLSAIAILDEKTGAGVLPFAVKDLSGNTTLFAGNAWIRKMPDTSFGKDIETREWTFDSDSADYFVGGNS